MQSTQFKKWSQEEENQLLDEIARGDIINSIALKHGRSVRAINIRLKDIAVKLRESGVSDSAIEKSTGITPDQITERVVEKEKEQSERIKNMKKESSETNNKSNNSINDILVVLENVQKTLNTLVNIQELILKK